jgi:C-terminal processing protease CtpA/Prc
MILETNAAPHEFDMSGLFITSDGAAFKAFKVYKVIKDSPGAQAGIREGDVIAAIDDRPASDFTLEQIRQMFKENEGKEHKLTVKRDGTVVTTRLQLRRVI